MNNICIQGSHCGLSLIVKVNVIAMNMHHLCTAVQWHICTLFLYRKTSCSLLSRWCETFHVQATLFITWISHLNDSQISMEDNPFERHVVRYVNIACGRILVVFLSRGIVNRNSSSNISHLKVGMHRSKQWPLSYRSKAKIVRSSLSPFSRIFFFHPDPCSLSNLVSLHILVSSSQVRMVVSRWDWLHS